METEDVKLSICIALKVGCGSLVTHPGREYDDQAQQQKRDVLGFESMKNQFGLSVIYYTALKPNFTEILDTKLTQEQKAELLARAAIDSVTHETYRKGGDGIHYLADNIEASVVTVLTEPYAQGILDRVGNAPNLSQARRSIAQQKGIIA